jgi:Holliday junction resolvase
MGWSGNARLNAQRDLNERPIIETLEARGYHVTQINGKGVPDLLVSKHGQMWLVEVKQPKGKYNPRQVLWHQRFQGPTPITLRTVEEALQFPEVTSR